MLVPSGPLRELHGENRGNPNAEARLRSLGIQRIWPNLPLLPQHAGSMSVPWPEIAEPLKAIGVSSTAASAGNGINWAIIDTDVRDTHTVLNGHVTRYVVVERTQPDGTVTVEVDPAGDSFAQRQLDKTAREHGTHVAGIIRAVAPGATIVSIALECEDAVNPMHGVYHQGSGPLGSSLAMGKGRVLDPRSQRESGHRAKVSG